MYIDKSLEFVIFGKKKKPFFAWSYGGQGGKNEKASFSSASVSNLSDWLPEAIWSQDCPGKADKYYQVHSLWAKDFQRRRDSKCSRESGCQKWQKIRRY